MNNYYNNYYIRNIKNEDYLGFKKVYLQLENTLDFTEEKFIYILSKLNNQNSKILLVVNSINNEIVGVGKILVEYKFGNNKGYIDDLVIDKGHRKQKLGTFLLNNLIDVARNNNCYTVKLLSSIKNLNFYKKNNFILGSNLDRYTFEYKL